MFTSAVILLSKGKTPIQHKYESFKYQQKNKKKINCPQRTVFLCDKEKADSRNA